MPGRFVVAWFRGAPATTGRGWRGTGRGAWFVHVNRKVELLRWQVIHLGRLGERLEDPAAPRALILGAELGGYRALDTDLHSPVPCPLPDLRISRHVRDSISVVPEQEIASRGGAVKWRTVRLKGGRYIRVAVVRKKGKRGGRTVAGKVHHGGS